MTIPVDPIAIALAVTRALDALGIVHTIGGSIRDYLRVNAPVLDVTDLLARALSEGAGDV